MPLETLWGGGVPNAISWYALVMTTRPSPSATVCMLQVVMCSWLGYTALCRLGLPRAVKDGTGCGLTKGEDADWKMLPSTTLPQTR
jgi:hypothetical protein